MGKVLSAVLMTLCRAFLSAGGVLQYHTVTWHDDALAVVKTCLLPFPGMASPTCATSPPSSAAWAFSWWERVSPGTMALWDCCTQSPLNLCCGWVCVCLLPVVPAVCVWGLMNCVNCVPGLLHLGGISRVWGRWVVSQFVASTTVKFCFNSWFLSQPHYS